MRHRSPSLIKTACRALDTLDPTHQGGRAHWCWIISSEGTPATICDARLPFCAAVCLGVEDLFQEAPFFTVRKSSNLPRRPSNPLDEYFYRGGASMSDFGRLLEEQIPRLR